MLMPNEILIGLECEPVDLADPAVRASIKEVRIQLEKAGLADRDLIYARSGTIMASLVPLGPYLVPVAQVALPILSAILLAWVKMPRRKVKVKIGDTLIEANSVEEVERLLSRIKEFQGKNKQKKEVVRNKSN